MSYNLTGATVSSTYGRLVQVALGSPNTYYDGFGNLLDLGAGTVSVGPQGPTGSAGSSISWMGSWDEMMMYFENDAVYYNGSSYICVSAPSGSAPYDTPQSATASWDVLAEGQYAPFYFQPERPATDPTVLGSRWIDSDTGKEYVWVFDGSTYAWMQPTQLVSMKNGTSEITGASKSAAFTYNYYGVVYMGGICTVTLPLGSSPEDDGKFITIADEVGGVSRYNRGIRVQGTASQLINGESDVLMKMERMSLTFMYRNSSWKTI